MHTNWHSDDSDAASWMDEQGSEGHSSSLTHQPFLLHPNATPSQQRDANDDIAEAIQSIQFDMELWHDMYAVSAPYISPSQQDAWKAIVTQMQQVSHRIIGGGHDVAHEATSLPTVVPERKQRHSSIVSDAQPESYWAGLWSRLGDVENDPNRVMRARTMPGDEYVLQQIWSCLDSQDFAAVAAVCSDWFRLVYHSKLGQRQWQHIVRSRWPHVHGWDGDHAFVSRVCGTTRDWRHRFITLHNGCFRLSRHEIIGLLSRLSSNWQHGRLLHQSTIPVELTPTIRCMQFVDQSRLLLLGDSRGGLQMRNLHRDSAPSSMELPAADGVLRAHSYSVTAISSHGDRAVSGSVDGTLSVHALSAFHTSPVPHGHLDAITCVELHQDVVASGSKDATVRLWDLRNVQSGAALVFEHRREAVRMATLSPADATKWLVFYDDGMCCVADVRRPNVPVHQVQGTFPYKASAWVANSMLCVVESDGGVALINDCGALVRRRRRPFSGPPLTCFPVFHGNQNDGGMFGVATSDPNHAVEIYHIRDHGTMTPAYSLPLPPSPLRCSAADWTSVVGVDDRGLLHEWSFDDQITWK